MGDKILKSLQFPGSSDVYKIPQSDYAQTDSTQPDYIKNKLVGKEVTYSDTLTWDGNTDGLESVDMSLAVKGMIAYKISDNVITQNDFNYGFSIISPTDGEITISHDEIADLEFFYANGFIYVDFFAVVPTDNFVATDFGGIMFPSKGVYAFVADGQPLLSSITINNYTGFPTTTTKKLTAEYLEPFEVVTTGGDTLTWDGDTSGKTAVGGMIYHVSDNVLSLSDFMKEDGDYLAVIAWNTDSEMSETYESVDDMGNGMLMIGEFVIFIPSDNFVASDLTFAKKGIYFVSYEGQYIRKLQIPNYTGFTTTEKKLKGEYVIDTNSIILKSSGGKRFKVTVSDTGTLTATEI